VSGNVSLYNESKATGGGSAILPTPAIGGVGLLQDWRKSATIAFKNEGDEIWLIGKPGDGHLGQSLWLREIADREDGPAPSVDLPLERKTAEFLRHLIENGIVNAVHDLSDGGLLVAVAEMALAGDIGADLDPAIAISDAAGWFGEDQGRYVVTVRDAADPALVDLAQERGIYFAYLGTTEGRSIAGIGADLDLADLRRAHEGFFPKLMGGKLAVA
jgi:phosphoribosylformylglycinamidine synthase